MIRPFWMTAITEALRHLNKPINIEALSKQQARTLIATDALAGIHTGKLIPKTGKYLIANMKPGVAARVYTPAAPAHEILTSSDSCQVCALGSMFAATIGRDRTMTQGGAGLGFHNEDRVETISCVPMRDSLGKYFSPEQIGLMECAFELSGSYMGTSLATNNDSFLRFTNKEQDLVLARLEPAIQKAIMFGEQFQESRERLIAILTNVINNCGEFKP